MLKYDDVKNITQLIELQVQWKERKVEADTNC